MAKDAVIEAAQSVLMGVHALLRNPAKPPWLVRQMHYCEQGSVETLALALYGRNDPTWTNYWTVYVVYSPFEPSLQFKVEDKGSRRVLYALDLRDPKSLTRATLRAALRETRRRRDAAAD